MVKKSKVIPIVGTGLLAAYSQCEKRAWLEVNEPQSKELPSDADYWQLQAEAVNRAAKRQFSGAFTVQGDLAQSVIQTNELLAKHTKPTLFKSAFVAGGIQVSPDVLEVRPRGSAVSELTASTCINGVLDRDKLARVALRAGAVIHVLKKKKHMISSVAAHALDRDAVWDGVDPTYEGLLRRIDITPEAVTQESEISTLLKEIKSLVNSSEPKVNMTRHCKKPFPCPFTARCQAAADRPSSTIYDIPGKHWKLQDTWAEEGYYALTDVPEQVLKLAPNIVQKIVKAIKLNKPWKSKEAKNLLKDLPYPRYWFDFEAIALALPAWKNRRSYEQVTFQWSAHIEHKNGTMSHKAFLDLSGKDPARSCAESLIKVLKKQGPIIVYHAAYESSRLKEMAERFPDLRDSLLAIVNRLVDLEKWIHAYYYHPLMKGSYSIKKVLPALAPHFNYDGLPGVHNGVDAQMAYLSAINAGLNKSLFNKLRDGLLAYCSHDTWAMIEVAYRLTGKKPPKPPFNDKRPAGSNTFSEARIKDAHIRNVWQLYENSKPLEETQATWMNS